MLQVFVHTARCRAARKCNSREIGQFNRQASARLAAEIRSHPVGRIEFTTAVTHHQNSSTLRAAQPKSFENFRQGFAATALPEEPIQDEADDPELADSQIEDADTASIDFQYRAPTQDLWPASPSQRRIAGRVHKGLEAAIQRMCSKGDGLIQSLGLSIEQVRMSPDNMKAFILWSGLPETEDRLEQTLQIKAGTLRMVLAHEMRIRRVPRLEFRRNQLTAEQQALEEEFERLRREG